MASDVQTPNTVVSTEELDNLIKLARLELRGDRSSWFDHQSLRLIVQNEENLDRLAHSLAKKYFPDDEEGVYAVLDQMEERVQTLADEDIEKKARKFVKKGLSDDPLAHFKLQLRGKTYQQAVNLLFKINIGGWAPVSNERRSEDEVEQQWTRLWQSAHGGFFANSDRLKGKNQSPDKKDHRLSEIRNWNVHSGSWNDVENRQKYEETQLCEGAGISDRFPETVKVFRGVPRPDAKLRYGDYVTLDRNYAETYIRGKHGTVLRYTVPSKDLIVMIYEYYRNELLYAPDNKRPPEEELAKTSEPPPMSFRKFWEQNQ